MRKQFIVMSILDIYFCWKNEFFLVTMQCCHIDIETIRHWGEGRLLTWSVAMNSRNVIYLSVVDRRRRKHSVYARHSLADGIAMTKFGKAAAPCQVCTRVCVHPDAPWGSVATRLLQRRRSKLWRPPTDGPLYTGFSTALTPRLLTSIALGAVRCYSGTIPAARGIPLSGAVHDKFFFQCNSSGVATSQWIRDNFRQILFVIERERSAMI